MSRRVWSLREWVSRLLAGGAVGCVLLFLACVVSIILVWEPRLLKGDPRWQSVFFIANFGLPASIAIGALAGLVWRRSQALRLSGGPMACCCVAIALVSRMLRPVVDRNPTSGIDPRFEVVPDTLFVSFCVLALMVAVWRNGSRLPTQDPNSFLTSDAVARGNIRDS